MDNGLAEEQEEDVVTEIADEMPEQQEEDDVEIDKLSKHVTAEKDEV